MKSILLAALLTCIALPLRAVDLDEPYTPTRREWLLLLVKEGVHTMTSVWSRRIAVSGVIIQDEVLTVGVTTPNGEPPYDEAQRRYSAELIRSFVEGTVSSYPWASHLRVEVVFVE